ncbi:LuxR C-terminal-related transcriptional regulator [Yinghuangia sp. ASG 101]|uniref:LuxR C-terminal-related transcriptional regulator n=1 Tax=Yinghuangia sp. ASG 101 TaxID=2896848 RepID=UPI001E2B09BC|nr:LuxR C-terminal-related transcriptional regulator [Yinghuangia sp. ASG 101]UGQ11094.1 LuxR C-terminal-related transcriptional regulator [Yinghuangia sp. ASG 101]
MARNESAERAHLPADVTSLIGRRAETAEVKRLLTRSRLVTLTGPGGVGKTRLALHVARTLRGAFPDGATMVPLVDLSQPDLLDATVSARIDPGWSRPGDAEDPAARIGTARVLLVLDNCEHLAEPVAVFVARLLSRCPNLHVLATSRAALRIDAEALYRVPPLAVPAPGARVPRGAAAGYDGVALFLERAGALNAEVAAGRVDETVVVELCRRLDGLPLAIELAAAGSRWQSVESMLNHPVPDPPAPRSAPQRHTTMRASLDYSRELCTPEARLLWLRFSVFRGGATIDAVTSVCAGPGLPPEAVASALFELVEKSVVNLDGSRYTMLETIRRYGARMLAESGEADAVRRAHLAVYAGLAERVRQGWFGLHQRELHAQVLSEHANVRAALETSLGDTATARTGLRLALALFTYWIGSGVPGEGRRWLGRLLDVVDESAAERAEALWQYGFLSVVDGDIPAARELLAESWSLAGRLGDAETAAHARWTMGLAELFDGRVDAGIDHLEAGIAQARACPDSVPFLTDALINLGLAYCYRGDLDQARAVLAEATRLCSATGEELLFSWILVFRALEALLSGRVGEAQELAREALRRKRELVNLQGMVWAVEVLAWAAMDGGQARRAALLLEAAGARAEDFGPAYHGFPGMREWHEHYALRARDELGKEYAAVSTRGREMSLGELVTEALSEAGEGEAPAAAVAPAGDSVLHDLPLTPRERQIAGLLATGKTNREIAAALVIAPRTVDTHVQRILTKLDFTSRSQVVALVVGGDRGR